jgi:hypothetical protein
MSLKKQIVGDNMQNRESRVTGEDKKLIGILKK